MPGGPYITVEVEGGKKGGWKEGGWIVPRHTTSVSLVSLSVESPVRHQRETIFPNKTDHSFILLKYNVFSSMLVLTAC